MVNENFLKNPCEQRFYKFIAWIAGILGLNTHYWSWYEYPPSKLYAMHRRMVMTCVPISVSSMIMYLALHYKEHEFNVLASILSVAPYSVCLVVKLGSAQTATYKAAHTDFMDKVHLHSFYVKTISNENHKFVKTLLLKTEKNSRYLFYGLMAIGLTCSHAWALVPLIHNIHTIHSIHNITTKLEQGIYYWQPFDFEYNFYGYIVSQLITFYCCYAGPSIYVFSDTLNIAYILHLTGHIQIFKHDLELGQNKKLTDEEWEKKLKEMTARYSFITKTFKNLEGAYGFNVASIYAQVLIEGGLIMYQFTASGIDMSIILTYGLMLPVFMGTLVVISATLENVRIQADDIPDLVYALPWESMSVRNQKLLQSIIFQVQPTLEYKAAFNIKAGVQPAINIIKTTFSYYVMIKSRKEL